MRLLYILCFSFLFSLSYGQFHVHTIDVNDGLSSNSVEVIFEDSKGYMWIGTNKGLDRYNGHEFRSFSSNIKSGISTSFTTITSITEDKNGYIWVGGRKGKVARYNPQTDRFKEYSIPVKSNSVLPYVNDIMVDNHNMVWILTSDQIYQINEQNKKVTFYNPIDTLNKTIDTKGWKMSTFLQDINDEDILWIGTFSNLLCKLNRSNNEVRLFKTPNYESFGHIYQHDSHTFYAINNNGVLMGYDHRSNSWSKHVIPREKASSAKYVLGLSKNELLITTSFHGLMKFDIENKVFIPIVDYEGTKYKLGSPFLLGLYKDRANNIWVGTQDDGLRIITKSSTRFKHWILPQKFYDTYLPKQGYKRAFIHDLHELDHKNILFSVNGLPYIFKSDHSMQKITKLDFEKEIKNPLYYSFTSLNGILGIWTNHGFVKIDLTTNSLFLSKHAHRFRSINNKIIDTLNNKYWFTSIAQNGCASYDPLLDELTIYRDSTNIKGLRHGSIKSNNSKLWFTNGLGIKAFNPNTNTFHFVPNEKIDPINPNIRISGINFINDSILVLSGINIGIFTYNINSSKIIKRYMNPDQLLSNQVHKVLLDQNNNVVYISYAGMGILDINNDRHQGYTEKSGLLNDLFGLGFTTKGNNHFIFGGYGFATRINTQDFLRTQETPTIRLETLEANDIEFNTIEYTNNTFLEPDQNFITIHYSVNQCFLNEEMKFEYMLDGIDPSFKKTNSYSVNYTNLGPGEYIFKIRPVQSSLKRSEFREFRFHIIAQFWQTWWFKVLLILAFSSLIFGIYKYRISLFKKEAATKRKFEAKIKEIEMVALRSQMNPHFLFNSLNSIKSFIARNEPRKATNYLSTFAQLMRYILANSEQNTIPLSKELNAITLYMDLEAMRFNNKFQYNINLAKDVHPESIMIQPLILQPYIENAIWHGLLPKEENGQLEINISINDKMLEIIISDNGIGRKASKASQNDSVLKRKTYGLRITSDRLQHYSKESSIIIQDILCEAEKICGTKVIISFPIKATELDS